MCHDVFSLLAPHGEPGFSPFAAKRPIFLWIKDTARNGNFDHSVTIAAADGRWPGAIVLRSHEEE
jgi:hypothetical protein